MGLITRLLAPQARGPLDDFWYSPIALAAGSGVQVTADTALKTSAVWACVRLISETIASLPLFLYGRTAADGTRRRDDSHPLYRLLHGQPNNWQTALEFREQMTVQVLLRGNAYAQKVPGPRGAVDQLVPLNPDRIRAESTTDGAIRYRFRQRDGTEILLNAEDIFHLRGLSLDGISGISVIDYGRETIGLAIAEESYAARLFSQDGRPGGVLEYKDKLSPDAVDRLKKNWEAAHTGLAKAHRVAVLEEGMKFTPIQMAAKDLETIAQRQFSIEDIARWFRVPLHMIGSTTKETSWGSGIEQLSIGFVTYTLLPWLKRWEQAIARDLLVDPENFFAEHLVDGLLRGDQQSRYNAYAVGRNWGWLSANDVRRLENMNPVQEGDVYLQPLNMVPAGTVVSEARPGSDAPAAAHHRLLVWDAAARIIRKEMAAMSRAWKRCDGDSAVWDQAREDFYADHAAFVAQTLRIGQAAAEHYCAEQLVELDRYGLLAMEDWEIRRVEDLVTLALGVEKP